MKPETRERKKRTLIEGNQKLMEAFWKAYDQMQRYARKMATCRARIEANRQKLLRLEKLRSEK